MNNFLTHHARIRIQQRGISVDALPFIEKYGHISYAPGGVKMITLHKKNKNEIIKELKRAIGLVEKAGKLKIIQNKGKIITIYHKKK